MNDTPQNTIIKVKNLSKFYLNNIAALRNINLEISQGSSVAVIGRSGCGKTTLLRCLNCLEIPDEGSMQITGINIEAEKDMLPKPLFNRKFKRDKERGKDAVSEISQYFINDEQLRDKEKKIRMRVGFLFQNLNLFSHLSVIENITIAPRIVRKMLEADARIQAFDILKKVGLEKFGDYYPHQLSGGQAQRVAIGRTLAMSPRIMLYDEPTSALDPELIEELAEIMLQLKKEGLTQIVVTHSMKFARKVSDTLIYMEDGEIIEVLSPAEEFSKPKNPRTRQFLSILD